MIETDEPGDDIVIARFERRLDQLRSKYERREEELRKTIGEYSTKPVVEDPEYSAAKIELASLREKAAEYEAKKALATNNIKLMTGTNVINDPIDALSDSHMKLIKELAAAVRTNQELAAENKRLSGLVENLRGERKALETEMATYRKAIASAMAAQEKPVG